MSKVRNEASKEFIACLVAETPAAMYKQNTVYTLFRLRYQIASGRKGDLATVKSLRVKRAHAKAVCQSEDSDLRGAVTASHFGLSFLCNPTIIQ